MMHRCFSIGQFCAAERRLLRMSPGGGPDVPGQNVPTPEYQALERASNAFFQERIQQRLANVPNGYVYGRTTDDRVGPYAQQAAASYRPYGSAYPSSGPSQYGFPGTPYMTVDSPYASTHPQPDARYLQGTIGSPFPVAPFPDNPGRLPGVQNMPGSPMDPYVSPYGGVSPYYTQFRWYPEDSMSPRTRDMEARGARPPNSNSEYRAPAAPNMPSVPVRPNPQPNPNPAPNPGQQPKVPETAPHNEQLTPAEVAVLEKAYDALRANPDIGATDADEHYRTIKKWNAKWAENFVTLRKGSQITLFADNISPAVAREFAKHNASLYIDAKLTAPAMIALRPFAHSLYLYKVDAIPPDFAQALRGIRWANLQMDAVTSLTPEAAEGLADIKGQLFMNGVSTIDAATAEKLAAFQGSYLQLGVTELDAESAKHLGTLPKKLYLSGLKKLTDETAKHLSEKPDAIDICLEDRSITPAQAAHLGRCPSVELNIESEHLTAAVMKAFAEAKSRPGDRVLTLNYVRTLKDDVALEMGKFPGSIKLDIDTITPAQLRSIVAPGILKSVTLYRLDLQKIKTNFAAPEDKAALKKAIDDEKINLPTAVKEWATGDDAPPADPLSPQEPPVPETNPNFTMNGEKTPDGNAWVDDRTGFAQDIFRNRGAWRTAMMDADFVRKLDIFALKGPVNVRGATLEHARLQPLEDGFMFKVTVRKPGGQQEWYLSQPDTLTGSQVLTLRLKSDPLVMTSFLARDVYVEDRGALVWKEGGAEEMLRRIEKALEEKKSDDANADAAQKVEISKKDPMAYIGVYDSADTLTTNMKNDLHAVPRALRAAAYTVPEKYTGVYGTDRISLKFLTDKIDALTKQNVKTIYLDFVAHGSPDGLQFGKGPSKTTLTPAQLTSLFTLYPGCTFVVNTAACHGGGLAAEMEKYTDDKGTNNRQILMMLQTDAAMPNGSYERKTGTTTAFTAAYLHELQQRGAGVPLGQAIVNAERIAKGALPFNMQLWVARKNGISQRLVEGNRQDRYNNV